MHYMLLIYFNNKPLHVSSRLAAHYEEDQLSTNSNWFILYGYITIHGQQNFQIYIYI